MPLKLTKRKGSPFWYVRGTYLGRRVYESTGTSKRTVARQKQANLERQIEKGGRVSKGTFGEACAAYLKHCPEAEYPHVDRVLEYFKDTPLIEIDQLAIDVCADVLYPKAASSTVNRNVITPLSAILHNAATLNMCPWVRLRRRKEKKTARKAMTPDEFQRLRDNCGEQLEAIVLFMATTGARAGEAITLTWEDIDLSRSHVTFTHTKNGETYGSHLHPEMVITFANMTRSNNGVFGYSYVNRKKLNRDFNAACDRAGLDGFTPHCLRHTYATWLRQGGADLRKLMELGRWKDVKSVIRYAHVTSDEQKDAIEALPVQKPCIARNRGAK